MKSKGPCGQTCQSSDIGPLTTSSTYGGVYWHYDNGSFVSNLTFNLNYNLTSVNDAPTFEQGDKRFMMPIPTSPRFTVR